MRIIEGEEFTWYQPSTKRPLPQGWLWKGGKWVVHDSLDNSRTLVDRLAPHIESGRIDGAKIWHGDPTAAIVYSLDTYKDDVYALLDEAQASSTRVWVYDNPIPNFKEPCHLAKAIYLFIRTETLGAGNYRSLR